MPLKVRPVAAQQGRVVPGSSAEGGGSDRELLRPLTTRDVSQTQIRGSATLTSPTSSPPASGLGSPW